VTQCIQRGRQVHARTGAIGKPLLPVQTDEHRESHQDYKDTAQHSNQQAVARSIGHAGRFQLDLHNGGQGSQLGVLQLQFLATLDAVQLPGAQEFAQQVHRHRQLGIV